MQASFFGFGPTADIEIEFNNEAAHAKALVKREANAAPEKLLLFSGKQAIEGTVRVILKPGVRLDHTGIKIELFGQIELAYDRGNSHVFTSLVLPLEQQAGALTESKAYPFDFTGVEKAHETYNGVNVRLRYVGALLSELFVSVRVCVFPRVGEVVDSAALCSGRSACESNRGAGAFSENAL